jgi:hypothetical protein
LAPSDTLRSAPNKTGLHPLPGKSLLRRVSTLSLFEFPSSKSARANPPPECPRHPSTHTYRLLIFKEQAGLSSAGREVSPGQPGMSGKEARL